jgi:hypothetical protein
MVIGAWMTRTAMDKTVGGYCQEDKTVGGYCQEPAEQKHLMEAMVASSHVGDRLSLLQLAPPIGAILLVLKPYTSAGPSQPSADCSSRSFHGHNGPDCFGL